MACSERRSRIGINLRRLRAMRSLIPATYVATFTSWTRATSRARKAALLFLLAVLLSGSAATVRGQSALDGFDPNLNGAVRVFVVQPDGKILIGGDFTTVSPNGGLPVTRNHMARLNPDGTLDTAFNPNANDVVHTIALQADGKILAGGDFTNIGGQTRNYMARLNATTGRLIRSTRTRTIPSLESWCRRTERSLWAGLSPASAERRATASRDSMLQLAWQIHSIRIRTAR